MTDLLSIKRRWQWTPAAQKAMDNLKAAISRPRKLDRPHPDLPYTLQTDASAIGAGAVLYQQTPEGQRRIISYASTRFGPAERKYHCNEQECLAAIWAIRRYRPYLEDRPFVLKTDSRALTWLNSMKDHKAKLTRWSLLLQEFDFQLEHCPGRDNELPDALSRNPDPKNAPAYSPPMERLIPPAPSKTSLTTPQLLMNLTFPSLAEEVRNAQKQDPQSQTWMQQPDEELPPLYRIHDGVIQHGEQARLRLYVPAIVRPRVMYDHHDPRLVGHPGARETLRAISERYYWPLMKRDVEKYVRSCPTCACAKAHPQVKRTPLRSHHPHKPWDVIALDWMGPYPKSKGGKRFLLVITDLFSRWIEAFPTSSSKAPVVKRILETEIFPRYGYPRAILSDNAPQFSGKYWADKCHEWQTQHWTTPVYHPRANPTERRNQDLKKGLRIQLKNSPHTAWADCIPSLLFGIRSRRNAATGLSPSQALFGNDPLRPGHWQEPPPVHETPPAAAARHAEMSENQAAYQDKYAPHTEETPRFRENDLVYVKEHPLSNAATHFHAGFASKYSGPYPIARIAGPTTYWVNKENCTTKYHADQLYLAAPRPEIPRDMLE